MDTTSCMSPGWVTWDVYFGQIKNRGIELVEIKVPNKNNHQSHYKRFLANNEANIKKAKDYLSYLAYKNKNRKNKNKE